MYGHACPFSEDFWAAHRLPDAGAISERPAPDGKGTGAQVEGDVPAPAGVPLSDFFPADFDGVAVDCF